MDVTAYSVKEIYCDHDFNCRGQVAPIDVIDLAKSIELTGLLQPITIQSFEGKERTTPRN